ncbi:hypothetical protein FSP39_010102 [Pinctada imbricata]|uniref:Uncharacterized protein n=1 Tax=Pinctada imbricata TaxID=66713 RepID=A0AA88YE90_PINIB|nr:hypothetical protein FSP39_010102 [Pinctada imbricata]
MNSTILILFSVRTLFCINFNSVLGDSKCSKVNHYCKKFYNYEILGEKSYVEHSRKVFDHLSSGKDKENDMTRGFYCVLYHPPCLLSNNNTVNSLRPKPCQGDCKTAWKYMRKTRKGRILWPKTLRCEILAHNHCYSIKDNQGDLKLEYVSHKQKGTGSKTKHNHRHHSNHHSGSRTSQKIQLLSDDDNVVEVLNFGGDQEWRANQARDYGANTDYFHGWVDIQGKGSNDDYCRVIGKGHRKFLACAVEGSTSKVHMYVSKLGFDAGLRGSGYMRDEDWDGRDDYCRCVGTETSSHVSCMKAGEHGFYGGPMVGGNQYTFSIPDTEGCFTQA